MGFKIVESRDGISPIELFKQASVILYRDVLERTGRTSQELYAALEVSKGGNLRTVCDCQTGDDGKGDRLAVMWFVAESATMSREEAMKIADGQ